jgi:hypothetical protein
MIRKWGCRFPEKIMHNKMIKRNGDSTLCPPLGEVKLARIPAKWNHFAEGFAPN